MAQDANKVLNIDGRLTATGGIGVNGILLTIVNIDLNTLDNQFYNISTELVTRVSQADFYSFNNEVNDLSIGYDQSVTVRFQYLE